MREPACRRSFGVGCRVGGCLTLYRGQAPSHNPEANILKHERADLVRRKPAGRLALIVALD